MTSQTKDEILRRHQANTNLNLSMPGITMQDSKDLGADTSVVPIDEQIISAASKALEDGNTHYVDVPGIAPLRDTIADYLNQKYDSPLCHSQSVGNRRSSGISFPHETKISEEFDDQIAIPEVVHPGVVKAVGMRPRTVKTIAVDMSQSALPRIAAIQKVLGGTRLIYLESPSRLTGEIYRFETNENRHEKHHRVAHYGENKQFDNSWEILIADADYASTVEQIAPDFPQLDLVCATDSQDAQQLASATVDGVITQMLPVNDAMLQKLDNLQTVLKLGRSYHNIDVQAVRQRGLTLACVPRKGPNCVAELALTFIMSLSKDLLASHESVATGAYRYRGLRPEITAQWKMAFHWMKNMRVHEIRDKTLGIIGMGEIGAELARRPV